MGTVKAYRFPVSLHWVGGRLTRVSVAGKHDIQVATPPEFRDGIAGVWSPEDLLVASVASCFAVTLAAVAERRDVPLRRLDVKGAGTVTGRDDGRFGFSVVELEVEIETDAGHEHEAELAAEEAEKRCLVAAALDVPVHVELDVRPVAIPAAV